MKVTLNPDKEVVDRIKEGLKLKDGYCPCRLAKTPENKCMCKEFRDQIADPNSRASATVCFIISRLKTNMRFIPAAGGDTDRLYEKEL